MLNPRKLVDIDNIRSTLNDQRCIDHNGLRRKPAIVFTNGCFDILHPGHVIHLQQARQEGDLLVVGLNSDESVRQLKGPTRPIFGEMERAIVLSALESVDYIVIFNEPQCAELIRTVHPDVYVKGGDYLLGILDEEERSALEDCGAEIHILPLVGDFSTSKIINGLTVAT